MPDIDAEYNFNSIKVQLKLPQGYANQGGSVFQFHKGTIKTQSLVGSLKLYKISIP